MNIQDRVKNHLIATTRSYPNLSKHVDMFRQSRGVDLPKWHDYCFLPMAAWYSIISNTKYGGMPLSVTAMKDLQMLAACGTWRYTQGIYQFDPDIYNAVIDSKINGALPSTVLVRLPEWCLYVETPDLQVSDQKCYGFFVWLEHDMNKFHTELRILVDGEKEIVSVPLHLGDWDLKTAVEKYIDESGFQGAKIGHEISYTADDISAISADIMPIVSLILYICSDEPDLSNLEKPSENPSQPQPKKTKKGWRLFPADNPKIWSVGLNDGETLRKQVKEWQTNTGRTVKPHVRRGHYHTYWIGKRGSDEQKAISKWIMPTIVGAKDDDE